MILMNLLSEWRLTLVFYEDLGNNMTLREKVIETIKQQIFMGNLKPGARLLEEELSKAMNVSRAPIREAFGQLESEGLLKVVPRKGVFVSTISAEYIKNVYELSEMYESTGLKKSFALIPHQE
jgi:DNA-binding GntR family transcriptional regulator